MSFLEPLLAVGDSVLANIQARAYVSFTPSGLKCCQYPVLQGAEGICWLLVEDAAKIQGGEFYLDRSPQPKHLSGPFFSEGSYTKNTPKVIQGRGGRTSAQGQGAGSEERGERRATEREGAGGEVRGERRAKGNWGAGGEERGERRAKEHEGAGGEDRGERRAKEDEGAGGTLPGALCSAQGDKGRLTCIGFPLIVASLSLLFFCLHFRKWTR